jgi:hypothetical protein
VAQSYASSRLQVQGTKRAKDASCTAVVGITLFASAACNLEPWAPNRHCVHESCFIGFAHVISGRPSRTLHLCTGLSLQCSHNLQASWSRPRSSCAGTMRSVLVWPIPPLQPCTQITGAPFSSTPSLMAFMMPHFKRRSTSSCHGAALKSGFSSAK